MKPNGMKSIWRNGGAVLNGWLSIANPFTAEIMASQGYDSITIDLQHGIVDYQTAVSMFQAMAASGITPVARVPWLDPAAIMKILDAGAYCVICPMINTREDAERLVSYVRYPPQGCRSFGPSRAVFSAGADYSNQANQEVICFGMIETRQGFDNLDDIVSTPGLAGVYIGPADLTLGLTGRNYPTGFDRKEPEMVAAIQKILATAHDAGVKAALHCGTPAYAAKAVTWGFDLVTVSNDVRLLAAAASASVQSFRDLSASKATL